MGIAIVHSIFKLLTTALLMPFHKKLVDLACLLIRDKGKNEEKELLDERLFVTPPIALARARSEETCSLSQLCDAADWLLRWGGKFVLVHRPERLADLIWELRSRKLEPKRIRFVRHRPDSTVNLVLLEARKGGNPGLAYEPDLIFYDRNGTETEEYRNLYHKE